MKKIIILFLILSTSIYSQKKLGNEVFKMEFLKTMVNIDNEVNTYYTDLVERCMYSKKDNLKYGFLNNKGKVIIQPIYSYGSDFFKGKSNIILDTIPGLVFIDGKQLLFPEYSKTYWYYDELGLAVKNKKYGFINTKGEIIIPIEYDNAFPFFQNYTSVKKNDKWNYIDKNGNIIFPDSLIFNYRPIIDNKAVFMKKNIKVEKTKKMQSEDGSRTFVEFLNKTEKYQLKEGLIDTNGNIILEPKFDEISGYYQNGYMRVRNNGKTGIIDEKGEIIIPIEYDDISDFKNSVFLAKKNKKWGMINEKNNIVIPIEYNKIRFFSEGLALISLKGKIGYIDSNNKMIIEPNYKFNLLGDFSNGLATIRKDDKYGYINKKNEIIIPINFRNALPFNKKYTLVKKDNRTLIINKKGKEKKKFTRQYLWKSKFDLIRFAKQ